MCTASHGRLLTNRTLRRPRSRSFIHIESTPFRELIGYKLESPQCNSIVEEHLLFFTFPIRTKLTKIPKPKSTFCSPLVSLEFDGSHHLWNSIHWFVVRNRWTSNRNLLNHCLINLPPFLCNSNRKPRVLLVSLFNFVAASRKSIDFETTTMLYLIENHSPLNSTTLDPFTWIAAMNHLSNELTLLL